MELQPRQGYRTSNLEAEDNVHANPSVVTAESKLIAAGSSEVHRASHSVVRGRLFVPGCSAV